MRIFLDLEATERGEIISIGAITEAGAAYEGYIKPRYSCVTGRITKLTGITQERLMDCNDMLSVLNDFLKWCIEYSGGHGFCFIVFGNDKNLIKRTHAMYAGDEAVCSLLNAIRNVMVDGKPELVKRFYVTDASLRTMCATLDILAPNKHGAYDDARLLREVWMKVVDEDWYRPSDMPVVVVKSILPQSRRSNRPRFTPAELDHKVIAYWKRKGEDKTRVFDNMIDAAADLGSAALRTGHVTLEQYARRILAAAVSDRPLDGRRFFLV